MYVERMIVNHTLMRIRLRDMLKNVLLSRERKGDDKSQGHSEVVSGVGRWEAACLAQAKQTHVPVRCSAFHGVGMAQAE